MRRQLRGFSLIEMMITIAIVAIMLAIATPSFREWMNNARIRTAAESIQNGLRNARNEAAQRATWVRFELTSATGAEWRFCELASAADTCANTKSSIIQTRGAGESAVKVAASTAAASTSQSTSALQTPLDGGVPAAFTFGPLARAASGASGSPLSRVDISGATVTGRRLSVLVSSGGMVRMCDPDSTLSATNAQSCASN